MTSLEKKLLEALRHLLGIAEDEGIVGDNTTLEKARAAVALAEQRGEPSELVYRLRDMKCGTAAAVAFQLDDLCQEAADRIEALERELAEAKAAVSPFNVAYDQRADVLYVSRHGVPSAKAVELKGGIVIRWAEDGSLAGVTIIDAAAPKSITDENGNVGWVIP